MSSAWPAYNETTPTGGDALQVDVNAQYTGLEFHYVYQVILGCFVYLIVPGIGLLYGGMSRRKSALAMIFQSMTVMAMCTAQWMFWGFSLAFSRTGSPFIGDLSGFLLRGVAVAPSWGSPVIPDIVFVFYELMFAACATMIVVGGAFERGRVLPSILFGFCWVTICYCPIAYWTWNANGWLFKLGALDFAGGGPVHMSSGSAGLAYALILGKRLKKGEKHYYKPHNISITFLGTVLIWFGWFGFNGGSALNATMRSMVAVWNTNCAACFAVIAWTMYHYAFHRKFTVIGSCEAVVAGLVGVTPAAGYVTPWGAAAIGFITALVVCVTDKINEVIRIDDGLKVFKLHAIGGACGAFLTGCFATSEISALDGIPSLFSGAIDGNGVQIGKQIAEICAICSWSFSVSCILLLIMKYTPGLHLRVNDEIEMVGLDVDQFDDEMVGEWSFFEKEGNEGHPVAITHGVTVPVDMNRAANAPSTSSDGDVNKIEEKTKNEASV